MMPTLVVTIIPAKPFAESKKRLSSVLSQQERISLSRNLLQRTIEAAIPLGPVVVVSRSINVRDFAAGVGAATVVEENHNLNDAICQGIAWARTRDAAVALILPLDLPLLTTSVLENLLEPVDGAAPTVVIAPCRHRQGTNALVLTPPDLLRPEFGPRSFARHRECAQTVGVNPTIYHSPQLAFDLDTPQDWREFVALESPKKRSLETSQIIHHSKF